VFDTFSSEVKKIAGKPAYFHGSSYFLEKNFVRMLATAKVFYLSPGTQPEAVFLNFNGASM
jgi:hypothetical protein